MARTVLPVLVAVNTGVTLAFTAADLVNGNTFINDGHTLLVARNTGGAPLNVTLIAAQKIDGDLVVANRVEVVPAASSVLLRGAIPADVYNQPDGTVFVDCSAAAGLLAISI